MKYMLLSYLLANYDIIYQCLLKTTFLSLFFNKMFVKRTSEHIRIVECELWFMGLWIRIVIYRVTIRIRNLQFGFGSSLIFQILNPSQNENKILILQNTYIWIVDCDMIFIIPIRNTDLKHLVWQCLWYMVWCRWLLRIATCVWECVHRCAGGCLRVIVCACALSAHGRKAAHCPHCHALQSHYEAL